MKLVLAGALRYQMGDFARHVHPLTDSIKLTIQRINSEAIGVIIVSSLLLIAIPISTFPSSLTDRASAVLPNVSSTRLRIVQKIVTILIQLTAWTCTVYQQYRE